MLLQQIDIYIYAILMLLFVFYDIHVAVKQKSRTAFLFQLIVVSLVVIQIFEMLAWVADGQPGIWGLFFNYLFNYQLFAMILVPLSLWMVYLDESIIIDEKVKKRRMHVYWGLNLMVLGLVATNPLTGFIFTISSANVYARQSGVIFITALNIFMFGGYLLSIQKYNKIINSKLYQVVLSLGIFPLVGAVFQAMFYKQTLTWPLVSLVALSCYILVQRDEMKRDELTGLYTRANLEKRISQKIRQKQPFTFIMIDLDRFKQVNDIYGHLVGDAALIKVADLLMKNIKAKDSAFRIGGDEFVLVIESTNVKVAHIIEQRIKTKIEKINLLEGNPYELSMSFGHAVYDGVSQGSLATLLEQADDSMYQNKKLNRARYDNETLEAQ